MEKLSLLLSVLEVDLRLLKSQGVYDQSDLDIGRDQGKIEMLEQVIAQVKTMLEDQ